MNEQQRWVMFFVMVAVVLFAFSFLNKAPAPTENPAATAPAETEGVQPIADTPAAGTTSDNGQTANPAAAAADDPAEAELEADPAKGPQPVQAEAPSRMVLKADWGTLEIDNKGARLSSALLFAVDPADTPKGEPHDRQLISPLREQMVMPLDVPVGETTVRKRPFPLNLVTGDESVDAWLADSLWVLEKSAQDNQVVITARLADGKGLSAEKTLMLDPEHPYLLSFSAKVESGGRELPVKVALGPSLSPPSFMKKSTYLIEPQGITGQDDDIEAERASAKEPKYEEHVGSIQFGGIEDNYFAFVYMPNNPVSATSLFQVPVTLKKAPEKEGDAEQEFTFSAPWAEVPVDPRGGKIFLGPKMPEVLAQADPRLSPLAKLGFIQTPLLQLLRFIHGLVGNWGWAIVGLTLLVRLLFYPITYRNMVKMRLTQEKMKKVNPKVQRLRDRYKKLPKDMEHRNKMNQEMMALYNKEGVNPMANMAGCLPMLLQIPIFWALFRMLPKAFELRGEPFMLWIKDLSAQDPTFLTPILVGVTMFLSTRLSTGQAMENMQKYMLYVMPFMFLVFCLTAPMGLNVYWTTNNLLSMIQQRFINKKADQLKAEEAEKEEALRKAKKKKKKADQAGD